MLSKRGLFTLIILSIANTNFAQSIEQDRGTTNIFKNFSIYTEGDSGNLTKDVAGQFAENYLELGMIYEQNFAKATWFSMYIQTALEGSLVFNHRNLNTGQDQTINPDFVPNGVSGADLGVSFLEVGFKFSEYFRISLRQNLLIKAFAYMPIHLPGNTTIKFSAGIEAYPYFIGQKNLSDTIEGKPSATSIDNLMVGMSVDVKFAPNWNLNTGFEYRTSGAGTADRTGSTLWAIDSLEALRYNSEIRLEGIISYTMNNGIYLWGGIRYETQYFTPNPAETIRLGYVQHRFYLRGGFKYTFDFAKL